MAPTDVSKRISRRALLGGGAALGLAAVLPRAQPTTPLSVRAVSSAVPASSFVDSVAVGVHWAYPDTPYGFAYDRVRDALVDLGVRHVRGEPMRAADLHARGVQSTVLIDSAMDGSGDPVAQVLSLRGLARTGAIAAIEGPNEADLFWVSGHRSYRNMSFPDGAAAWQADLYATVKGDPDLAAIPVIGPSFGHTYWGGGHPFARGSLERVVDYGNMHPYPRGNPFAPQYAYAGIERYYNDSDFPSTTLDVHPINMTTYRPPFGARPMMATETGYSTWRLGVSEYAQGIYVPRLFLEFFRLGIARTYLYELVDEFIDPQKTNSEANFGLIRRDLTPKPAYYALQSLLRVLTADGSSQPEQLDVECAVTAAPGYDPAAVHHLTFSLGSGRFVVAIWHEVSHNDTSPLDYPVPGPRIELNHPPAVAQLTFSAAPWDVSVRTFRASGHMRPQGAVVEGATVRIAAGEKVSLVMVQM